MIFWELFWTFFQIGAFTFGGGYAMLPLIQSEVASHGWMTDTQLVDFVAVSESTPGPFAVNISTYAYDPTDKDSSIMVGTVAIADKVTYEGVALGGEYKLVTTVVDAATGEAITVDGEPVSATHTFTAESTSGYEVVEMEVPTYELGGRTITIYEELYQVNNGSDTLIADHKDKDDVEQQLDVIAPEIGTSAKDGVDGDKNVVTDGETSVVDTVSYTNLIPGKEYTVKGTLMVKGEDEDGEADFDTVGGLIIGFEGAFNTHNDNRHF
mgnify:CR=1 FL=1